ncbi:MAG TPA: hypothetical protein VFZ08_09500 [Terriglobia bacterium]|nr:hypothetical protein [Terriglobia bacterium]
MSRRAYLYFVITFIIGIILGGAGMYYYAWGTGHWRRRWSEERVINNLKRDLDLSPQQVPEIRSILDDNIKKYHAIQDSIRPQMDALHHETDGRIRHTLNPQQLKKFNELVREHQKPKKNN